MDTILNKPASQYSRYAILKYNLKERYESKNALKRKIIYSYLVPKFCSKSAFFEYMNIKKTDQREIPANVLRAFANAFQVPMEHLFND